MTTRTGRSAITPICLAWFFALSAAAGFLAYKLSDLNEPFAYGHTLWSEAYTYLFARGHLDLGLSTTLGLNVEGITGSGEPIFYLSGPPLGGLMQALVVAALGGEPWTIRVLPLLFTLMTGGLIAALASRQIGTLAAPLAVLLFVGMPFELKYGASNEGLQIYAIAAGLAGYLSYMRFLASRRWLPLGVSAGCFALGVGFNWLAGFMAFAMLAHLWLQPLAIRVKIVATLAIASALGCVVLAVLIQQGAATGEFLYPFRRALERGGVNQENAVSWTALLSLQSSRYLTYYGPVVSLLSAYWLLRRLLPTPKWEGRDTWAVLAWSPGLAYGFLLRGAAYNHDYLMLGFLPGATLLATLGLLKLMEDLGAVTTFGVSGKRLATLVAALLLGAHALNAYRSALYFERQEDVELAHGPAQIALYLERIPADAILAADWSTMIKTRIDGVTGKEYASVLPYLDYLARRPVRAVDDIDALHGLMCEARQAGKSLILLQARMGAKVAEQVPVPVEWIAQSQGFDKVFVLHLDGSAKENCLPDPTN